MELEAQLADVGDVLLGDRRGDDFWTTKATLEAIGRRPGFGLNFDPSHMNWQFLDPVAFLTEFANRIYHCHAKESERSLDGRNGVLSSHLPFGDLRRGWDFVSVGHGSVPFERILRALNAIGYDGPLSVGVGGLGHGPRARRAGVARVPAAARLRARGRGLRRRLLESARVGPRLRRLRHLHAELVELALVHLRRGAR